MGKTAEQAGQRRSLRSRAVRHVLRREAARFLLPDESIQAVIPGVTVPVWKVTLLPAFVTLGDGFRAIVCTNRRILLCRQGLRGVATVLEEIVENVPREGRNLGPPRGLMSHRIDLFSEPIYIHRRFFKDIVAADSALSPQE